MKQIETVSGAVRQVNAKGTGIKVSGVDDWLNVSQYHPIATMPTLGELVEVQFEHTDRGLWITSLQVIGASAGTVQATDRERIITRLSVLRSAATFCSGRAISNDVKSTDVLAIADAWLKWVEREEVQP
jgi:hypothetical protein